MVGSAAKKTLSIPVRLVFTESGISHFVQQNKQLTRFRTSDDREEYGIHLFDFEPQTMQKLLRLGYVRSLDVSVRDLVRERRDVIDLAKLLIYGMLYMQYEHEVYQELVRSPLVDQWNRQHARYSLDHATRFDPKRLRPMLARRRAAVEQLRRKMLGSVERHVEGLRYPDQEERTRSYGTAHKFLDALDPLFWLMTTANAADRNGEQLVESATSRLLRYLRKTDIAEYVALLIIELLMHLRNNSGSRQPPVTGESAGASARAAAPASTEPAEGNGALSVLWQIRKRYERQGDRGQLHIVISDSKASYTRVHSDIRNRSGLSIERSLRNFYADAAESDSVLQDTSLGLYYLNFLRDACQKQGISFESFVNQPPSGVALIHLVLQLGE
jgi:hypothetical protein